MQYTNPNIECFPFYKSNDLGKTLYDVVLKYKPKKIIEFGPLNGYTTVAMAMALDELKTCKIISYDLFEDYQYKHSTIKNTQKNIDSYGLSRYVKLKKKDFNEWLKNPEDFDLLYIDLSNTGEIIEKFYGAVKNQIDNGSIVVFEGGSEERDNVEWMNKYNKKKVGGTKVPYKVINWKFPSLSMIVKK